MKGVYTLILIISGIFTLSAQTNSPVIKKYSKIHKEKKYVITETIFADGHIENYITSVPLADLKKIKVKETLVLPQRNIDWDENANEKGLQISLSGVDAIESGFNNALLRTEEQLGLPEGQIERISLGDDFMILKPEVQSLVLINSVIKALASADEGNNLIPLEGVDKGISADAKGQAENTLGARNHTTQYNYIDFEYAEHMKNDAIFLTNSDQEIAMPHIQAIYNWLFADQYTGWYNRRLLLNKEKNNGPKGLNDDFNLEGAEGYIGVGVAYGKIVDEIIANPTFEKASAVCLQLVDPTSKSKYAFEMIQDFKDTSGLDSGGIAVDE